MKRINKYINEKLQLTTKQKYTCHPKDWSELQRIIIARIKIEGLDCDLNDIDVSKIKDMSFLFDTRNYPIFKYFNGDISMWDVSNVTDMKYMFCKCEKFNCDISKWDVSNVENMRCMFYMCGKFDRDLSNWNVSNVKDMYYEFEYCPTKPKWYDTKQWE